MSMTLGAEKTRQRGEDQAASKTIKSNKTTSAPSPSRWKDIYDVGRKYRSEWSEKRPWLEGRNEDGFYVCFCSFCSVDFAPKFSNILRHEKSKRHMKFAALKVFESIPQSVTETMQDHSQISESLEEERVNLESNEDLSGSDVEDSVDNQVADNNINSDDISTLISYLKSDHEEDRKLYLKDINLREEEIDIRRQELELRQKELELMREKFEFDKSERAILYNIIELLKDQNKVVTMEIHPDVPPEDDSYHIV